MLTQHSIEELIAKLKNIKENNQNFTEQMDFYLHLMQIYNRLLPDSKKLNIHSTEIKEKINSGKAILSFDKINVDWNIVIGIFNEVLRLVSQYNKTIISEKDIENLQTWDKFILKQLMKEWYEEKDIEVQNIAIEANILGMLLSATMYPILYNYARELAQAIPQESWRRRTCPVCGGKPDFAYLEKELGSQWLLCSRCDSQWLFQRLKCPYCGNSNQDKLSYFATDDELYRLYICNECKFYLKAIDLRKTQGEIILQFERLNTMGLDIQAKEKGYKGILN